MKKLRAEGHRQKKSRQPVKHGDRVTFNIEPDVRKPNRMRAVKVRVLRKS